ncbi:protein ALP1-like [Coffea eugenioides]|uniref:protein ALP1-like n=1 Tax=Coffea eugenioides TaxID=49369 RepID=UPI000F60A7C6|nr:protein ALP1-like [Coffea eugenioides]
MDKEGDEQKTKKRKVVVANYMVTVATLVVWWHEKHIVKEPYLDFKVAREIYLRRLYYGNNRVCVEQLRLNKHCFTVLCTNLREHCGLRDTRNITVEEAVAMFLYVLAHNFKNRTVNFNFIRSGETVSRYFNIVLCAIIKLGRHYLIQPETEMEGYEHEKWEWFQDCLGALDGTYVKVHVLLRDQGRYRNRKNEIATNVLGVCSRDMRFTYVLPGWEGSAADSRVLRDALVRSDPLIVPKGKYFLVDAGYANSSGFLAPYRGVRYHLSEWSASGRKPQNFKELFNLRHSIARNVIERTFGLFKKRWAILRDASFFDVKTHVMIINACAILHNLIRVEQPNDPYLDEVDAEMRRVQHEVDDEDEMEDEDEENGMEDDGPNNDGGVNAVNENRIRTVQPTSEWTQFRNALARAMFIDYQIRQGHHGS